MIRSSLLDRGRTWAMALTGLAAVGVALTGCAEEETLGRVMRTHTEEFKQNTAAKIDTLWVVDNSESMAEEQSGLGESFQVFVDNLVRSGVDFHIGVISTDPADGGVLHAATNTPPVIDNQTPDPQAAFLRNVRVGTTGSRIEKAFETAAMALGQGIGWQPGRAPRLPDANVDFLRPDASLFIIMVSDEDDKSFGPVGYYRRLFESYKGPGNESLISISAVAGPSGGNAEGCYDAARGQAAGGRRYIDLAGQTGGIFASICDDFNISLNELSMTAAGLQAIYALNHQVKTNAAIACGSLEPQAFCVRVDGVPVPPGDSRSGWVYHPDRNAIVFGQQSIPPPQASITIEYRERL